MQKGLFMRTRGVHNSTQKITLVKVLSQIRVDKYESESALHSLLSDYKKPDVNSFE